MKKQSVGEFEQMILLALIRLKDNAYGMTIRQEIDSRTNRSPSIGAVYTTLERLERKGFVSSYIGEATDERGGRPKRYFKAKALGINALTQSKEAFDNMWSGVDLIAT